MAEASSSAPSARVTIEDHLRRHGISAQAWAQQHQLSVAVVEHLLAGEYPREPVSLHAIAGALGIAVQGWAEVMACGICRCTPEEGVRDLRWHWWRALVARGCSLETVAATLAIAPRALLLFAHGGVCSLRLRRSGLARWLGVDATVVGTSGSGVRIPALSAAITEAMRQRRLTMSDLASALGVGMRTLSHLRQGVVPRRLNPAVVPALAQRLGMVASDLAQLMAQRYGTVRAQQTLASVLMCHCFTHGRSVERTAMRLGISRDQLRGILQGRTPQLRVLTALKQELALSDEQWDQAARAQRARRLAPETPAAPSLAQLIEQAITAHGGDSLRWSLEQGLSAASLRRIREHGCIPRRVEVRERLMRALGLDRPRFDAAARRLLETPPPRLGEAVVVRTALQQRLLTRLASGESVQSLARAHGVSSSTIAKIIRHGSCDLRLEVRAKLSRALGMDAAQFASALRPFDSEQALEDDHELRLLSLFRRLSPSQQQQLVGIGADLGNADAR